jgi:hypothetical protein
MHLMTLCVQTERSSLCGAVPKTACPKNPHADRRSLVISVWHTLGSCQNLAANTVPEDDVVDVDAKAVKEATTREQATKAKVKAVEGEGGCGKTDQQGC